MGITRQQKPRQAQCAQTAGPALHLRHAKSPRMAWRWHGRRRRPRGGGCLRLGGRRRCLLVRLEQPWQQADQAQRQVVVRIQAQQLVQAAGTAVGTRSAGVMTWSLMRYCRSSACL